MGLPYNQLYGSILAYYLAPVGEAVPDVDSVPAGNWIALGNTEGDQPVNHAGAATKFYTNEQQGPTGAVRPQEDPTFSFSLVDMTVENYARVLDDVANVVTAAGPPAIKTMPLKRGHTVNEYSLLGRGETDSPEGSLPAQYVVPRGFFDGEPTPTRGKDLRPMLECEFTPLEDETVADADSLGYWQAQTA